MVGRQYVSYLLTSWFTMSTNLTYPSQWPLVQGFQGEGGLRVGPFSMVKVVHMPERKKVRTFKVIVNTSSFCRSTYRPIAHTPSRHIWRMPKLLAFSSVIDGFSYMLLSIWRSTFASGSSSSTGGLSRDFRSSVSHHPIICKMLNNVNYR